jgi:tetratricopeptide (TPR) repeat protein
MRLRLVARILANGLVLSFATCSLILPSSAQQSRTPSSQRGVEPMEEPSPEAVALLRTGPYHALVIGIDKYQNKNGLKTAVADAKAIDKILREGYGFHTDLLLNADATRDKIKAKLFEYRTKLGKDDNLLIYYAGHGINDIGAGKAYWLPVEAGEDNSHWIQSDEITADLKAIPAQHIIVISDSCYSGNMREVYPPSNRQIAKRMNGTSRELVSSGRDEPVSDEGAGGHSAFAGPLIKALENESDSSFSARTLFERIQGAVIGNSDQTPNYARLPNSGDDGFAEFYFFHLGLASNLSTAADPNLAEGRRPVAVLGLKNLGRPESKSLSASISEILSSELAAGRYVLTVSTEDVARAKSELTLPDTDTYALDTLSQIRKRLGVDAIFVGSYRAVRDTESGNIELHLCLQYTTTGHTVCAAQEKGSAGNLGELIDKATGDLFAKVGLPAVTPTVEASVLASYPANVSVMKNYADGLQKLRLFDYVGARDALDKAVASAPDMALIHSALAEVWSNLGYDENAKEESGKAFELSQPLPREEKLLLEGRYHELNTEWEQAIQIYKTLWTFFDDQPEYGLKLAQAQISAGKGLDAYATVTQLRKLPAPAHDDPRIDMAEAAAASSLSNFKRELKADEDAASNASAQGATYLRAQALMDECWALYKLGEFDGADKACAAAETTFAFVGDKKDIARTKTRQADILSDQGKPEEALQLHQQALEYMREIGSQRDIAGALVNIANLKGDRGDFDGAQKNYEEAIRISRGLNDKNHLLDYENDLAVVFYSRGDFEKSKGTYVEVLALANQIDNRNGEALALMNVGSVQYLLGELQDAEKNIQAGLDISKELGTKSTIATSLEMLGDVRLALGDLSGAESNYQESRRIFEETGEKESLANSLVSLAGLELEEGSLSQAEELARLAAKECSAEQALDDDASANDKLVRALIAQNKLEEAKSVMQEVLKSRVHDVTVGLSLTITEAWLEAKEGNGVEAKRHLDDTISRARSMGLIGYEFEARLARAEIELQEPDPQRATVDLKNLENEANAKGYRLIGQKAAKLESQCTAHPGLSCSS